MNDIESTNRMIAIMARIKERRIELGMSYQDLADKTGLSKSTLQRYETGNIKNMPLDKLGLVAEALTVSPAYLMGWDEEKIREIEASAKLLARVRTDKKAQELLDYYYQIEGEANKDFILNIVRGAAAKK